MYMQSTMYRIIDLMYMICPFAIHSHLYVNIYGLIIVSECYVHGIFIISYHTSTILFLGLISLGLSALALKRFPRTARRRRAQQQPSTTNVFRGWFRLGDECLLPKKVVIF